MRKIRFLIFFLFSLTAANAQTSYADIQKNVKAALKSYSLENPNYPILKKLVTAFEKAKKSKPAYLEKDNLGIAIFLSSQIPELDIFPARYTFEHERINFSALRNKKHKKAK